MFQMFGFGGAKCARCEHKNAADAQYCARCGVIVGAPRSEPVLRENRWVPGPDELAVFFGVRALSGVFVKTLRVPATARAYILQAEKATEVPQGEYEIEGFFSRLNNLLRDQHAEILVTRTSALPVPLELDDLMSAEHLAVSATLTISVRIEQVGAFARHFMSMPGTVTVDDLRELLLPSVRQIAAEFMAAQSLRDMAKNRDLRVQFDERLQGALKLRLSQFGLAVEQVDTMALRHDRFDANRARIGSLWLATDERHVQLEHARQLDELYNDEQWQKIEREAQDARLRLRREELRQDEGIDKAGLTLQNAERMHALRAREIDLYGRIAESRSRKEALEHGAAAKVAELEHELAQKGAARADEAAEWAHLRQLAQLHMRTELEVAQQTALEQRQLAQQGFSQQLLQQQIRHKIEQANTIEDASRRHAELVRLRQGEQAAARRLAEIEDEQHRAQLDALTLAHAAHRREAERIGAWEDELALERQRELLRGSAAKESLSQHEKLMRTIEADGVHARQSQQIALDGEARRQALRQETQEAEWQQQLRVLELEREERFAQLNHAADLARIAIARAESIGAMSDTAKLALADAPNAAALADYMKTQVHANMSADQLAALAGVVAAGQGASPAEVQAEAARERQERGVLAAEDRRHQLELLRMQNDVNKTALGSIAQASSGAAPRQCPNGHAAAPGDKFCALCGAALQPS